MNRVFKKVILRIFIALIALGLLAVPALYLIALNSPTVSAAWFNDFWAYRQKIPINTHTASETNVYNEITVDTASLTTDKLQADCDDLRFTKLNGEILPYQIVSGCDSATTTIRVGFDTMPAAPFDVYMYYGNPSASTGSQTLTHSACGNGCAEGSFATEEKAPSPSAYWKFDDGQGQTTQDSTTNNNDGTLGATSGVESSDPTWQTEDVCVSGKCLKFDGTDDYIEVADNNSLDGHSAITVSAWIKPNNISNAMRIVDKWSSSTGTWSHALLMNNTGKIVFGVYTGSETVITSSLSVSANNWSHVMGVYDGSTIKIYINGKQDSTTGSTTGSLRNGTSVLRIGFYQTGGDENYFKGFIDDVKIYPYARSAAQILADYNSRGNNEGTSAVFGQVPSSKFQVLSDGLVGYWKMDEASANSCTGGVNDNCDSSGNGNDGGWNGDATSTAGKYGNGTTFDGTGDYVTITHSSSEVSSSWTIGGWIYTQSCTSGMIYSKTNNGAGYYRTLYVGTNKFQTNYSIGASDYTLSSTTDCVINTWTHVILTYNSNSKTLSFYINGNTDASVTLSSNLSTQAVNSIIGAFAYNLPTVSLYAGKIDDFRLYNRALSPAEISSLYNFAPGPVGYWKMDDASWNGTSGEVKDSSGNGNNGTGSGGVTTANTGKYGKAGNFGGNTPAHQVNVSDSTSLRPNILTASAWIKLPNSATGSYQAVLNKHNVLGFYTTYGVWINPSGKIYAEFRGTSNTSNNQVSSSSIVSNTWTHIAVTMTDTNMNFYINGVLDVARTYSSVIPTYDTQNLYIGWDGCCSTQYFNGQIDEVKFYNYARTQKQIIEDMGGGHPAVTASGGGTGGSGGQGGSGRAGGAVGYWKFDEGYGTTAHNSGSQGETLQGSLSGFASPATTTSGWTQAGKFNRGLNFDGSDDYVDVGKTIGNLVSGDGSVCWWIKPATAYNDNTVRVMWGASTGASIPEFSAQKYSNNNLYVGWNSSGQDDRVVVAASATNYPQSQWVHYCFTWISNGTSILYINGVSVGTASSTTVTTPSTNFLISKQGGMNSYFNGSIDEVKIYPYALTADEVKLDYNRGATLSLGALSDKTGTGYESKQSANQEYCIPGDSTACTAPVGRWDFDEGTGNSVNDKSGNNNIGTWNGTLGNQWKTGKIGKAGNFNGSDNWVDSGSKFPQLTSTLTISAWVKPGTNQNSYADIWGNHENGFKGVVLQQNNNDLNSYYFSYGNGTAWVGTSNTVSLTASTWQHVSVVKNSTTCYIYINAVESTNFSCTSDIVPGTTSNFMVGNGYAHGSTRTFTGQIDQVRIFNYARSAAQVAWDYNRGAPVAHYKMDECQGATAHDSSGNSNHGTLTVGASGTQTSVGTCTGSANTSWKDGATGKFNSSLDFDGTDDYVSFTTPSSFPTGTSPRTVSLWMKPAEAQSRSVFGYGTSASSQLFDIMLYNGIVGLHFHGNSVSGQFPNSWYTVGQWQHITFTYDSSSIKSYINGVLKDSFNWGLNTTNTSTTTYLGSGVFSGYRWFNGQLDDVRIFNYALTATQVKNLYNGGAVRYGPVTGSP